MQRRVIGFCLALAILIALTACSEKAAWIPKAFDADTVSNIPSDGIIAENDIYKLEWVSKNCTVALINKNTGERWGSVPFDEQSEAVDEFGMPIKRNPQLESAILVEYLSDVSKTVEVVTAYQGAVNNGRIAAQRIDNGICVEYYFDDANIMIPVEYRLRNESVEISIDPNDIQENENMVTAVSIAPFWCSAKNDSEASYLFIPSGSGALINCITLSQNGKNFSASVYGSDPVMQLNDLINTEKSIRLPVYGSKFGKTASCAIIESGSESADIEAKVGASAIGYSSVYATFRLRGFSENYAKYFGNRQQKVNVYSKNLIQTPLKIGFYPLSGENANYSGMAQLYKKYLKNNGFLNKKAQDYNLNITFIGGDMIDKSFLGIPYKSLLPATTISEATAILKEITASFEGKTSVRLMGFDSDGIENGIFAGGFEINKNLGTLADLSSLSQYCRSCNADLYFDFDNISLKSSGYGYSAFFDAAYNACDKTADLYKYNVVTRSYIPESKYHLLARELLPETASKLLNNISSWDLDGLSLSKLSNTAYSDYSNSNSTTYNSKGRMAEDVNEILKKLSDKYKIASDDANSYAAVNSDIIYNAPVISSQEVVFSEDIPFYQMVFKGYIPMAGECINLSESPEKYLLKSIEGGCGLSYTVISEYDNKYIDADTYDFYGSVYEDIKDGIFADIGLTEEYFKAVDGAEIVSHKILDNGLRETRFNNGIKLYVNYSDVPKESPDGQVGPLDFVWSR